MKPLVKILLGVVGGFSATGPMTATMLALHRWLPPSKQYPLPPREIAAKIAKPQNQDTETLLTLGSHFAYGSAMGGLYAATAGDLSKSWAWKGGVAGLVVWIASYVFLLPLLRILRPAHRQSKERSLLMIVAHLVWGVVLGGFVASTVSDEKSRGLFVRSHRPHRDRQ